MTGPTDSALDIRQSNLNTDATGNWKWLVLGLIIVGGCFQFLHLGTYRTLGIHESYAVVPAREMIRTGDWTVPRFGGIPRLKKPPLVYWMIAASYTAFGHVSEFTARFPSALAALALAVLMGFWAGRWYGRTAGICTGIVQLTSVYVFLAGRKAEMDMMLTLLIIAALFLVAHFDEQESRGRSFLRWIAIYALLAATWLGKFYYGTAMVMAPCVVYLIVQRRWRSGWHLLNPIGLLLMAAAAIIWPYLVASQLPEALEIWRRETIGRAMGELNSAHSVLYYIPLLLWLPMPWTPLVLGTIRQSWNRAWKDGDARERFVWVWFLTQLAIVVIHTGKRANYLYPMMPVSAILAGRTLAIYVERIQAGEFRLTPRRACGLTALAIAAPMAAAVVCTFKWPQLQLPAAIAATIVAFASTATIWLFVAQRLQAASSLAAVAFLVSVFGVIGWILPASDRNVDSVAFARELRSHLPGDSLVYAYRIGRKPALFYLDDPITRVETSEVMARQLTGAKPLHVLTYRKYEHELTAIGQIDEVTKMSYGARSKQPPMLLVTLKPGKAIIPRTAENRPQGGGTRGVIRAVSGEITEPSAGDPSPVRTLRTAVAPPEDGQGAR